MVISGLNTYCLYDAALSSAFYCQQRSLLPNVLKHGFFSRCFSNRCLNGQERLDFDFLVYRPIFRSSSFRDYFLLKNIRH